MSALNTLWLLRLATWLAVEHPPDPPETVRIATIAYAGGAPAEYGCTDDRCAFHKLLTAAKKDGASLAITSEYASPQRIAEPRVVIGKHPSETKAPLHAFFAAMADSLDMYVAADMETEDAQKRSYNSLVVFDPGGVLVARHDKVELFEGERQALRPGRGVTTLDTPFGRLGLLICADLYAEPRLHHELVVERGAQIVLVSAAWTVPVATQWQAAFARDWDVYVAAANASLGGGRGGGTFDPRGRALARPGTLRHLMLADVPVAPLPPSAGSNGAK